VGIALPLFPLGSVLFPGLLLPLRVFEPRYRALVGHLMALPDDGREFGVVAIRSGWEVERSGPGGSDELSASERPVLYDIGCTAAVRQINERPDGRVDLVAVGRRRFRVLSVDHGAAPYLIADVAWLPDVPGDADRARRLARDVLVVFQRYLRLLGSGEDHEAVDDQLPDDPTVLSHLVAATASLPVEERQRLLAEPDTVSRLLAERSLLRREVALLTRVRAVPVPLTDLATPTAPN
jgi:Lon protease-like protein